MTRLHHVKKARKSIKGTDIKRGDSYYWWQFAFRSKQVSKTRPRRSQYMTQSEHYGAILDLEDEINAMTAADVADGCVDDFVSQMEEIRDICQERFDAIPEQLQGASAGSILQEYIDNLDSWIDTMNGIDFSDLEDDFHAQAENEIDESDYTDDDGNLDEDAYQAAITEKADELEEDARNAILNDIQSGYPG